MGQLLMDHEGVWSIVTLPIETFLGVIKFNVIYGAIHPLQLTVPFMFGIVINIKGIHEMQI